MQAISRQLLAHRGPVQAEPLGRRQAIVVQTAQHLVQERRLYPAVLALVAGGRALLEGDRVVIADTAPEGVLFSL